MIEVRHSLLRAPIWVAVLVFTAVLPSNAQQPDPSKSAGPDKVDRFVGAAAAGDLDAVKKAIDAGVSVNAVSHSGLTALQAAKIQGQTETIALLTAKGADVSAAWPDPAALSDSYVARRIKKDYPAIAVLAARDGKIVFQKAYGFANLENRVPAKVDSKFRIGSITKQFTAAAILKLVEQGKIKLDDPLTKFIPDFPKGDRVTIHHLLTHTSGIHSYTGKPEFMLTVRTFTKPDALIKSFKGDAYDFEPGQRWLYNNSGFFLLGHIVEKLSGKTLGEYFKATFFDPIGMKDTGIHHWSDILANESQGYSFAGDKLQKAENWDMSRAGGAGALYSTVGDLYRWNEAVFNGKVLTEPSLKAAFTAVLTEQDDKSKPKEDGYGYGWALGKHRGLREISHGGGLNGFSSYLLRLPSEKFTVAVLINSLPTPPGYDAGGIAHDIASFFLWEKMSVRPVFVAKTGVKSEALDAYVGRYDYGAAVMTVTRKDNRLFAQLTGQPVYEIYPKSDREFFWKVVDAQLEFIKNDKGEVTKAIHHQNGQTINAARIPEIKTVKVDPKILATYVGKYKLGDAIATITVSADQIFAQLTGQPKFEIFAVNDAEFVFKIVHAKVRFVKDSAGKVAKIEVEQGGQKFEAPRQSDGE